MNVPGIMSADKANINVMLAVLPKSRLGTWQEVSYGERVFVADNAAIGDMWNLMTTGMTAISQALTALHEASDTDLRRICWYWRYLQRV